MNEETKTKDIESSDNIKNRGATAPARSVSPMSSLRGEIDQVFDRFLGESWPFAGARFPTLAGWDPFRVTGASVNGPSARADVTETDKAYEVAMELPGLDEKDVEVDVADDVLTVKGEKRTEREEENKDHHLSERRYGAFRRTFAIPAGVEQDKVDASFAKGVLTVTLPKSEEAQRKARKIEVKAH